MADDVSNGCTICSATPAAPLRLRRFSRVFWLFILAFDGRLCGDCLPYEYRRAQRGTLMWGWFTPFRLVAALVFLIVNRWNLAHASSVLTAQGVTIAKPHSSLHAESFIGVRYLLRRDRSVVARTGFVVAGVITLQAIITFLMLSGKARNPQQDWFFNAATIELLPATILLMTFALLNFFSVLTTVSVVGVMLGVGALTVVFSVTSGFQDSFRDKILGVNAHALVMKYGIDFSEYRDVMKKIDADPEVVASSPFLFNEMLIASARGSTGVLVKGIDPILSPRVLDLAAHLENGIKVSDLSFDAAGSDGGTPLPGIILGRDLAKTLKVKAGDRLRTISPKSDLDPQHSATAAPTEREFRVVGTFYSGFGEYDQKLAYVSLRDAQSFFPYGDVVMGVEVKLRDVNNAAATAERLLDVLGGSPFHTLDWRELNRNLFSAVEMQRQLLLFIMGIITAIAAFNIIAALTMLVVQKTREVAILQSMGLSDRGVRRLFVSQGLGIGVVGTLFGIAQGLLVCWLVGQYRYQLDAKVYLIDELPVHVQPIELMFIAAGTLLLCWLASLYPAIRGAALRPVDGLRYD